MDYLQRLFADHFGVPCRECLSLSGGGGSRRYYRLVGDGVTAIGTIAVDMRENEAFFAYTRHLAAKGMPVPHLYCVSTDRHRYLQQDLGDTTLYDLLRDNKRQGRGFDARMLTLYKQALADLNALQCAGRDMDFSVAYPRPAFDRQAMLWDLNYFKYHHLKLAGIPFDEQRLEDDFDTLVNFLLQADCRWFMYRDFNPRNIMVNENCESSIGNCQGTAANSGLFYVDYQGGRLGAAQYDVASLLYSASSDLPDAIRQELLRHYVALHGDRHFMDHFWGYLLIRILQTLGAYGYRGLFERKPHFLESISLAQSNLRHLLSEHPLPVSLPELKKISEFQNPNSELKKISELHTSNSGLTVTVMSFSYKQGLPADPSGNGGGYVFDCRALPNPGRYEQYRVYTGQDRPVIEFLQREPAVAHFLDHAEALVSQSVDKYLERSFTHLSVAFGCTGGQHRSVYCAEQLAARLRRIYPDVAIQILHRERQIH